MKFGVPWSVKDIRPETRESARKAARRSGMSLADWLNSVILQQAEENGPRAGNNVGDNPAYADELASVHRRLDDLTRRIDQFSRSGPMAYAPKRIREEPPDLSAQLIGRLDRRIEQATQEGAAAPPNAALLPSLDRAMAEIAARQRALKGDRGVPTAQQPESMAATAPPLAPTAPPPPAAAAAAPVPQDLSGLEEQLRRITAQIEALRRPGVEDAINALREELKEIGRALNEAMPRDALDTIERRIQGLSQRIAEGRQNGADSGALAGIEHGLAEVRDALRGLTPAESLVGFHDAVNALAQKIDLIVAQKDPATFQQLERAITTLREMAAHVASNEAVSSLASQVQMLGDKVEHMAAGAAGGDALSGLEHRIDALSRAFSERPPNDSAVPPRLEGLMQSLSEKIELIQQWRGDHIAASHLEDRIVALMQRLDSSDSRLGNLESIERALADLLVSLQDMRARKDAELAAAKTTPGVDALQKDMARTHNVLEAVNGTLGQLVDRIARIESDIRGEGRLHPRESEPLELTEPVGDGTIRTVSDAPALAPRMPAASPLQMPLPAPSVAPSPRQPAASAPAPQRMAAASLAADAEFPPDQPLEPGSGPPRQRAGARIAASEAALGNARPAPPPGGKSSFIAAARRAAQTAMQEADAQVPRQAEAGEATEPGSPTLRGKMMKRVKSLFIAASIVALVAGSVQLLGNVFRNAEAPQVKNLKTSDAKTAGRDIAAPPTETAANANAPTAMPPMTPAVPPSGNLAGELPPLDMNRGAQNMPSLLAPPALNPIAPLAAAQSDITGSIAKSAGTAQPASPPADAAVAGSDGLPAAIGGTRLRSAAVAGDAAAAYEVASRFQEGRGVAVSLESAALWFERAASKGLVPAQFRYASLLEKGQGVKKDLGAAQKLYLAAAAKGNAKAMHNLAVLYAEGADGRPDYTGAAQWFTKAARHGIADSQYNLGVLAARGLGIEKNLADSYKWFALAAAQGDKEAARKRDEVASQFDGKALAAAQHAVKTFVATPQPPEATMVTAPPGGWDAAAGTSERKPRPVGPMTLGAYRVGKR